MTAVKHTPLIVAVSGGVDSVVMLHMLSREERTLIVAHADHGIRSNSSEDEAFVKELAGSYGHEFLSTRLLLGLSASENTARQARYAWLDKLRLERGASAVATAHHLDDVLETMIINLSRGTGWRGLSSLRGTDDRYRPLLSMSKAEIVAYAIEHNLEWHEDSTNDSPRYLRNRVRQQIIPRLTKDQRQAFSELYKAQLTLHEQIDTESKLVTANYSDKNTIARYPLIMMPEVVAREVLRCWLGEPLESSRQQAMLHFAKTAQAGALWSLDKSRFVSADKRSLIVLSYRD